MAEDSRELTIVLAEDDEGHATLIARNLVRSGLEARIVRARNGNEALGLLESIGGAPTVVILDIRMPEMDGAEVLRRIKSNGRTASVPVYVLSTSDDRREVQRCFELGCNAYITKPVVYESFMATLNALAGFLQVSAVPVGKGEPR